MNAEAKRALEDLAYLKAIVEGGNDDGSAQRSFGLAYFVAGLLYGLETLVHWAQSPHVLGLPDIAGLIAAVGATGGFLLFLAVLIWRGRHAPRGGAMQRAFNAAFGATGMTNLALVAIFATAAIMQENFTIWLLYPAAVFCLQGAAWFMMFMLRRRLWLLAIALGWFATGVALGFTLTSELYVAIVAFGLLAFMSAPGAYLYFAARKRV